MKISRPDVDLPRIHSSFDYAQQEMRDFLTASRQHPRSLTLLISTARTAAGCGAVVAPDSEDVLRALRLSSQAHAALFALASSRENRVTVPLGEGEPITYVDQKADSSTTNVFRWLNGFYLAALCRDQNSMKVLFETPIEVLRSSSTRNPEYRFLLAEALHLWWNRAEGVPQKFIDTMQATDPERSDVLDESYTLLLDVPAIQCLLYAIAGESDFGQALFDAAQSHKKYWTKTKDRRNDWDGFLSIPLLATAVLAHDRGVAFDLDCDYVPLQLVRDPG
jgi:hypothetical protein